MQFVCEAGRTCRRNADWFSTNTDLRFWRILVSSPKFYVVRLTFVGSVSMTRLFRISALLFALGLAVACTNIGDMFAQGLGVPKSDAEAKVFYGKACDAGDQNGCRLKGGGGGS